MDRQGCGVGYSRGKTRSRALIFLFSFSFALTTSTVCADAGWVREKIRRLQTRRDLANLDAILSVLLPLLETCLSPNQKRKRKHVGPLERAKQG